MAKHRTGRLSEEIKKSISNFLINGAKDPRLTSRIISISGVEVTSDGSYATVYISPLCLSDEDKEQVAAEVLAGFAKAKGALRSKVSRDIKLRHTPELIFKLDSSMDYGRKIDSILEEIAAQPKSDDVEAEEEE
ncbi:MAG: 30S ribosome-binding factor RbfA [Clostridiales bacterium]|nr:30S ribosome-binding factor RbfA [Candidatus Crickella caballi]